MAIDRKVLLFVLPLSFPLLVFLFNLKAASFNCINSSDLGIYSQALYELAAGQDFNPFLTVRGIKIFNDHFDPIIILVAPLLRLFSFHISGVLAIEMLWVYATLALLWGILRSRKYCFVEIWYFLTFFILSKGLLLALTFPIHPTTWAIFPAVLVVWAVNKDRWGPLLATSLFICLFKEDFPFAVLGLAASYLIRREFTKFMGLFTLAVLFILFDFVWRPQLLGPTYAHGDGLLTSLLKSPLEALWGRLKTLDWGVWSISYPLLIPLGWMFHKEIKSPREFIKHPVFPVLMFLSPLLVIRLLANAFAFHYSAPIIAPLVAVLAFSSIPGDIKRHPRWAIFILLLCLGSSSSVLTKMVKLGLLNKSSKCIINEEKERSTQTLMKALERVDKDEKILSSGGVIPQVLRPQMLVYHLGSLGLRQESYDYLLMELNDSGDTWPESSATINAIVSRCMEWPHEIIQKDDFYVLMKGKFPQSCIWSNQNEP